MDTKADLKVYEKSIEAESVYCVTQPQNTLTSVNISLLPTANMYAVYQTWLHNILAGHYIYLVMPKICSIFSLNPLNTTFTYNLSFLITDVALKCVPKISRMWSFWISWRQVQNVTDIEYFAAVIKDFLFTIYHTGQQSHNL